MCAQQTSEHQSGLFEDEFVLLRPSASSTPSESTVTGISATFDSFPDALKSEALHRLRYLQWIKARLIGGWTEKNLKPLLIEAASILPPPAPNWRTLARWKKSYIQHGNKIIALIPRHQAKGNSQSRLPSSDEIFFEKAVHKYLVKEKPSIASSYQFYKNNIVNENKTIIHNPIKILSYKAFYDRIKMLPTYEVMKRREGADIANAKFKAMGSHKQPARIMERVEIDHTPLNLILLDDELLVPLGRPSLTLLIDCYSHCVVGFNLNFNLPGYDSVRNALLNSIPQKKYIKDKYPAIEHEWPCYGKPETLVVDNGVEFWSNSLEQACLELGINIQYNPVRKPWLKPMIERMFLTINNKLIDTIPGKTFSNYLQKGTYNPEKDAVMRFSTFLEIFHHWIIDVYHYEPDSKQRYIPILSWQYGFYKCPPAPITAEDMAQLEIILSLSIWCKHRKGGVHRLYLRYDSDELASYRMKYSSKTNGSPYVLVKFNPRDISYAYVFIDEIDKYIRVPCIDPEGYTRDLSQQQHDINLALHRNFIDKKIDAISLSQSRDYIERRITKELTEVRQKQKNIKGVNKIAKYRDIGSQTNSSLLSEKKTPENTDGNLVQPQTAQLPLEDDWDSFTTGLEPY